MQNYYILQVCFHSTLSLFAFYRCLTSFSSAKPNSFVQYLNPFCCISTLKLEMCIKAAGQKVSLRLKHFSLSGE